MMKALLNRVCGGAILVAASAISTSAMAGDREIWLEAKALSLTLPDGTPVEMWGYANCSSEEYANINNPEEPGCPDATSPGPVIEVGADDDVLIVHVHNSLPAEVNGRPDMTSFTIPSLANRPVYTGGCAGTTDLPRWTTGPFSGRVRSMAPEIPNGSECTMRWTLGVADKPEGTFLYQSGTHAQVQNQMGLYGAVTVVPNIAEGDTYPRPYTDVLADSGALLVLAEIDPLLHQAVGEGWYAPLVAPGAQVTDVNGVMRDAMTSTVGYDPKYYLINGAPSLTAPVVTAAENERIVIRLVNAGLENHAMQLLGGYLDVVGESGRRLPVSRQEHTLHIAAGQTKDAIFTPANGGGLSGTDQATQTALAATFTLSDRMQALATSTQPAGGLIAQIQAIEVDNPPVGNPDVYYIDSANGRIVVNAPGVLANDTDDEGEVLRVRSGSVMSVDATPVQNAITTTPALSTAPLRFGVNQSAGTNAGRVVFRPDTADVNWVGIGQFTYEPQESTVGQLGNQTLVSLVRDITTTGATFTWPGGGTADGQMVVGGVIRNDLTGPVVVSVSIVPNPANNVCTAVGFVGDVTVTDPMTDNTFTLDLPQPNAVRQCSRIRLDVNVPAASGIPAHNTSIERVLQRVNTAL